MSYEPVADSELAAVVTYLEMRAEPALDIPRSTLQLRHVADPTPDQYRALFRKVGSPWLWFSRLIMDDDKLRAIILDPKVELFEVAAVEAVIGMLELDFREPGQCELAFIGLAVLLVFTAEWCGICRAQAPYERFLLDKYARWPFALLGVETGSSREVARQARDTNPVTHRTWWDEPKAGAAGGPIANAWNVVGWPATYLIDGDGIIQFVDLREEDLLIAVRQLVEAQADREARPQRGR